MYKLAALFALLFLGSACATQPATSATSPRAIASTAYADFDRGDIEAVLGVMSEDLVWYESEGLPQGGVYQGPKEVMENVFATLTGWASYSAVPQIYIEEGNMVAVRGEYRGVRADTGAELKVPFVHIWVIENGEVVTFYQLTDTVVYNAVMQAD
ncbi:MAG: nuclear transport factor 2 family protein [Gammaproteobacteria bacterium]|nr:nuclear transport factor 2 family protein [Gammaproteobacteria bacterium]